LISLSKYGTQPLKHLQRGVIINYLKGELKFENYLDILEDKDTFTFCRIRTMNHRLPVEAGEMEKNY
jgi:hypothetical protein